MTVSPLFRLTQIEWVVIPLLLQAELLACVFVGSD
jgi:hypothetical protein